MTNQEAKESQLDLLRHLGGVARPVNTIAGKAVDSMIAVYRNRITYTFIFEKEVASIHFDRERREIFFKGHNVRHMQLTEAQMSSLKMFEDVLKEDKEGRIFFNEYHATLTHLIADK